VKILHLDTGKGWRGGQQQVLWLMEGLRKLGHEQTLAAVAGSPLATTMERNGFKVIGLSGSRLSMIRSVAKIAKGFSILHAHDANAHTLAWLAGASRGKGGKPFLVVSRRVAFSIGFPGRMKYASGDHYIAVSKFCAGQLELVGVPSNKISVVYDGVEMPSPPMKYEREAFRSKYGLTDNEHLMGSLTSLSPEKILHEKIDLLAKLPLSVHLWIGRAASEPTGDIERALLAHAQRLGVEPRFEIVPILNNATEFLRSLDLFIYLSRAEGLGSAILLAMAHGLPVIANRVGGIPEIVINEKTGILIDGKIEGDQIVSELVPAATRLLESADLRNKFGDAGREFVLEQATIETTVEKTSKIYENVLAAKN
jgi:glycosyltransferase involved in cell wall biosynthesis